MEGSGQPMNNAGDKIAPQSSKTRVAKLPDQSSPSDTSMRSNSGGDSERKNPLDALSRTSVRHHATERRSGLQDVDEEFLSRNIFARFVRARNTGGLNELFETERVPTEGATTSMAAQQRNQMAVAGLPSYPQIPSAGRPSHPQGAMGDQQGNHHYHAHAQQPIVQAQPMAQQPPQVVQPPVTVAQRQQQPKQAVAAQHQQQQAAAVAAGQQEQQQATAVAAGQQQQQQAVAVASTQHQQQQAAVVAGTQEHARMPGGYMEAALPEPDMCTTCPNCQATIYLLRNGAQPVDTSMKGNQEPGRN